MRGVAGVYVQESKLMMRQTGSSKISRQEARAYDSSLMPQLGQVSLGYEGRPRRGGFGEPGHRGRLSFSRIRVSSSFWEASRVREREEVDEEGLRREAGVDVAAVEARQDGLEDGAGVVEVVGHVVYEEDEVVVPRGIGVLVIELARVSQEGVCHREGGER